MGEERRLGKRRQAPGVRTQKVTTVSNSVLNISNRKERECCQFPHPQWQWCEVTDKLITLIDHHRIYWANPIVQCNHVSSFAFCRCDQPPTKSNLGKKWFIPSYTAMSCSIIKGSQGRNSRKEPEARNWSTDHGGTRLAAFPSMTCPTCFPL